MKNPFYTFLLTIFLLPISSGAQPKEEYDEKEEEGSINNAVSPLEDYWSKINITKTLELRRCKICSYTISPSGKTIFLGTSEGRILHCPVKTLSWSELPGYQKGLEKGRRPIEVLKVMTNGLIYLSCELDQIILGVCRLSKKGSIDNTDANWTSLETVQLLYKNNNFPIPIRPEGYPLYLALNKEEDLLFTVSTHDPKNIWAWLYKTWEPKSKPEKAALIAAHKERIRGIQYSNYHDRLVSIGDDGQIIVWQILRAKGSKKTSFSFQKTNEIQLNQRGTSKQSMIKNGIRLKCMQFTKQDSFLYLGAFIDTSISAPKYVIHGNKPGCGLILRLDFKHLLYGSHRKQETVADLELEGDTEDQPKQILVGVRMVSVEHGYPWSLGVTPDQSTLIVTTSAFKRLLLWDTRALANNPVPILTQAEPKYVWVNDKEAITLSSSRTKIHKWRMDYSEDLKPIYTVQQSQPIHRLYLNTKKERLYCLANRSMYICTIQAHNSDKLLQKTSDYPAEDIIRDFAESAQDDLLYLATGRSIVQWNPLTGTTNKFYHTAHSTPISSLCLHNRSLYTADFNGYIGIYLLHQELPAKPVKKKKKKEAKKEQENAELEEKEDKPDEENGPDLPLQDWSKLEYEPKEDDWQIVKHELEESDEASKQIKKKKKKVKKALEKTKIEDAPVQMVHKSNSPVYCLKVIKQEAGAYLYAGKEGEIEIWEIKKNSKLSYIGKFSNPEAKFYGLTQYQKSLFAATNLGVFMYDVLHGNKLKNQIHLQGYQSEVNDVQVTSKGNEVMAFGRDGVARWCINALPKSSGEKIIKESSNIYSAAIYQKSILFYATENGKIKCYAIHKKGRIKPIIATWKEEEALAAPAPNTQYQKFIKIKSVKMPKYDCHSLITLQGALCVGAENGQIVLWEPKKAESKSLKNPFTILQDSHAHRIDDLVKSEKRKLIASLHKDGVTLWNPFSLRQDRYPIVIKSDGIASSFKKKITLKKDNSKDESRFAIKAITMNSSGTILFTLNGGGVVQIWNIKNLAMMLLIANYTANKLSMKENRYFLRYDTTSKHLYYLDSKGNGGALNYQNRVIKSLEGLSIFKKNPNGYITSLTLHTSQKKELCIGTSDGKLLRWSVLLGKKENPEFEKKISKKKEKVYVYPTEDDNQLVFVNKEINLGLYNLLDDKLVSLQNNEDSSDDENEDTSQDKVGSKVKYAAVDHGHIYLVKQNRVVTTPNHIEVWGVQNSLVGNNSTTATVHPVLHPV